MTNDRDTNENAPAVNQPVDVLRDTNLKATIWRNEADKGPFYATTFARTFRTDTGEYRDTHSFVAADMLKLSELARKAYDRTTELRREDREQARENGRAEGPDEDRRAAFKQTRASQSRDTSKPRQR